MPATRQTAKNTATPRLPWLLGLLGGLLVLALGAGGLWVAGTTPSQAETVVVYKSPTCGCCDKWIEHMEANGFEVDARDTQDLPPIKAEVGIPPRLGSCHTAQVGGYFVEGHVPADLVARMLKEKPDIRGLAVPGMPMGSPGMEGPRKDPYRVYAYGNDGRLSVYAER